MLIYLWILLPCCIVDNIQNLCSNELMWQKDNKQKMDSSMEDEKQKTEKEFLEIIFSLMAKFLFFCCCFDLSLFVCLLACFFILCVLFLY